MTSVKPVYPTEEIHVPLLFGLLLREVSGVFGAEDWNGLRQSHFRVVTSVPPEGVSVTELADRVGMTKQGVGQFVTHLTGTGHLAVGPAPNDRRIRRVTRTSLGERLIRDVTERMLELEQDWAERVGPRRYRAFRQVLEELALS